MPEQLISASGIQYGLIINADGSIGISGVVSASNITGSVTAHLEEVYTQRLDYNSDQTIRYMGLALPGTSAGSANWQIRRFTWSNGLTTTIEFGSGNTNFDKTWNNRSGTNEAYS